MQRDRRDLQILRRDQRVDHPVEIVEEGEQVEGQFDPTFHLTLVQSVCVHDARWIIEA
jgi:hypothetical protein